MECSFWLPNKYVSFLDIDILLYVFFYSLVSNYVDSAGFTFIIKFCTANNSYLNLFMDYQLLAWRSTVAWEKSNK